MKLTNVASVFCIDSRCF